MSDRAPYLDLVLQNTPDRMRRAVLARLDEARRGDPTAKRLKPRLEETLAEIDHHNQSMRTRPFTWKARAEVEACRRHLLQLRETINTEARRKSRGRPRKLSTKESLAIAFANARDAHPRRTPRWIVEDHLGRANATNAYDAILEGIDSLVERGEGSASLQAAKRTILNRRHR